MSKSATSDLSESLRLETKQNELDEIETAFLETNCRTSFIKKGIKE